MIERDGERLYETVRELLDESELADIVLYETSGRRVDNVSDKEFALQVLTRLDDSEFEIRCKVTLTGRGGQYVADGGALFKFRTEGKIEEGIAREFAEKVGVMAIYPYLRAAVGQSASSLGLERPVLPLLRAGAIKLSEDTPVNELAEGQIADSSARPRGESRLN
jgi:hypothetical protein